MTSRKVLQLSQLICALGLSGCTSHPLPSPLCCEPVIKIDKAALSVERQMTQTEAERRLIRQSLQSQNSSEASSTPSEEELYIAGELICRYYKNSKTTPQRHELIFLLIDRMQLAPPFEAQAKAEAILNLIMLD